MTGQSIFGTVAATNLPMRSNAIFAILSVVSLAGCLLPYRPGALLRPNAALPAPNYHQLGCLDVRVTPANEFAFDLSEPVLRFEFGNRCDRPVAVDFRTLRARTRYSDGNEYLLNPIDPHGEIHLGHLDVSAQSWETIAFGESPSQRPPAWVCVDVSHFDADHPVNMPMEICVPGPDAAALTAVPPDALPPVPIAPEPSPEAARQSPPT